MSSRNVEHAVRRERGALDEDGLGVVGDAPVGGVADARRDPAGDLGWRSGWTTRTYVDPGYRPPAPGTIAVSRKCA